MKKRQQVRRAVVVIAVLTQAGPTVAASSPAMSEVSSCGRSTATTLAQTPSLRLYKFDGADDLGLDAGFLSACSRRSGKRFELEYEALDYGGPVGLEPVAAAGHRIATVHSVCLRDCDPKGGVSATGYRVVRVWRAGSTRATRRNVFILPYNGRRFIQQSIEKLAVKVTGATAFIDLELGPSPKGARYRVRKVDAGQEPLVLDDGPAIDPKSLALSGSTLSWTNGGQVRTATLY